MRVRKCNDHSVKAADVLTVFVVCITNDLVWYSSGMVFLMEKQSIGHVSCIASGSWANTINKVDRVSCFHKKFVDDVHRMASCNEP